MALSGFEAQYSEGHSSRRGYHHARVHEADVVYHVISRAYQGRWLLTPCAEFNAVAAGLIGRAQHLFPSVRLYAYAFLTNHFHLMLRGEPHEVPAFIGYIKRELSRRWGGQTGWRNGLWADPYLSTALPTLESQITCLRYVLGQGVKEGAVDVPERWPGIHIAHQLFGNRSLTGTWLDGTAYAKASFKDAARANPIGVDRAEYTVEYSVRVDRLPAFEHLSEDDLAKQLATLRAALHDDSPRKRRPSRAALTALTRRRFDHATDLPAPVGWEERRRMIHWAAHDAPETRAYVDRYWMRQRAFRHASMLRRLARDACGFPRQMFSPGRFEA